VWPRRTVYYRLRGLGRTGRVHSIATGSLIYLLRLARQTGYRRGRRSLGGRLWIELNTEPAVTVRCTSTQQIVLPRAPHSAGDGDQPVR
jgi:hypothetical protein